MYQTFPIVECQHTSSHCTDDKHMNHPR